MDSAALQFCRSCLSRRAGDHRYSPRPTHPGGRPSSRCAPSSPAPVRPPGKGCRGRGCALEARGELCESWKRLRRGSDWPGAPHASPAAAPPHSGEEKRGRWLLPPPRGQIRLMLQPGPRLQPGPPPPFPRLRFSRWRAHCRHHPSPRAARHLPQTALSPS